MSENEKSITTTKVDVRSFIVGKLTEFPGQIEAKSTRTYPSSEKKDDHERQRIFIDGIYQGKNETGEHIFIGHKVDCGGLKNKKKYHFIFKQ